MHQSRTPHRRAAALLLTAAALSFTPAIAQEAQPPAGEPVAETPAPVPQPVESVPPTSAPTPEPVAVSPVPTPVVETQEPAPARATRAAPRAAARAPAGAAPARSAAPSPAPVSAAPPAAIPVEAAPAPVAEAALPPVALPETPAAVPPAEAEQSGGSILPWLIAGLLAAGALAFFLLRRRRHAPVEREAHAYDEPVRESAPVPPAAAAIPAAMAWEESPHEPAAAPVEEGVPSLGLELRPRRAGVSGSEAIVEFDLDVANHGSAAARDVRVSTWMFQAGAAQSSEAEQALIDRPGDSELDEIGAGSGESMTRSVTLATSEVTGDAVLPMVVAEARYRLPDGSEARTSATYAVGVPDGEELAHFAIDNPSGLHEEVVAWELGKTEPA